MNRIRYVLVTIVGTCLRVLPFACKTGVMRIGQPDRHSPVLLTCNYRLTVERVRKALAGINCYLLVANSRGVNVWCAATGGLLTNHDVVSVLKTSGIEDLVDERSVILPQLAATGVEPSVIHKRTGWKVSWGPVDAKDIAAFVDNGFETTAEMRRVGFPWPERIEMAVAWAFPISIVAVGVVGIFWREAIAGVFALVWGLSLLMFSAFPLYSRLLGSQGKRFGFILFDFGRGGLQLVLWSFFMLGCATYAIYAGEEPLGFLLRWGIISFFVVLMLSIDLMGSTPVYKSGLHEERLLSVVLDEEKCRGAGCCEQVCPTNCFDVDRKRRMATMPRADACVQCGACIVQCPFNALYFRSPEGTILRPETVRQFRLNLMGKRLVNVEARQE
jgi:ferredoxin